MRLCVYRFGAFWDRYYIGWLCLALGVPCLTLHLLWGQAPSEPTKPKAQPGDEAVKQLLQSLPPSSVWRNLLEHGVKGDGIRRPWMDEMRQHGLVLAVFTFEFDWDHGGEGLEHLKNWRLVSAEYFTSYDHLGTAAAQPTTDARQISAISASGLSSRLEAMALARAKQGMWIESPGHQHPPRATGTGCRGVFLAENE